MFLELNFTLKHTHAEANVLIKKKIGYVMYSIPHDRIMMEYRILLLQNSVNIKEYYRDIMLAEFQKQIL